MYYHPYPIRFGSYYLMLFIGVLTACNSNSTQPTILFTQIASEHSGITFRNALNETADFNLFSWKYIYNGGGVATGDINNDGLVDIYFSGNANTNKLYLNKGNFQFEDITQKSKTGTPQGYKTGVSMVDINGDGWLDIYVCRDAHPNPKIRTNLVFINNQDLTFSEQGTALGLTDQAYSSQSIFFDMDRDNDLDLFLINHPGDFEDITQMRTQIDSKTGKPLRSTVPRSRSESFHLYENNAGHFKDITLESGLACQAFALSALAADFNHDGWIDLYVANDFIEPDMLFLNSGHKTFTEKTDKYFSHMSQNSMGSDLGDMNNDGLLDLVVLDMLASTNERQKVFATNMTQNRYEELARMGYGKQLMRNTLQLNTGRDQYAEIGCLSGVEKTDWSWSALFADLDLDGFQDLFITNGIKRDMSNKDFIDFQSDSIQRARKMGMEVFRRETVLEWINLIPSTPLPNYLYMNNKDLTFTNEAMIQGMTSSGFSHGAAYADLDNDGDLDLVVNNMDEVASLYRNNTREFTPNHYLKINLDGPPQNSQGIGSQITLFVGNTRQSQVIQSSRGYLSSSEPVALFGLGNANQIDSIRVLWPDQSVQTRINVAADEVLRIKYQKDLKHKPAVQPQEHKESQPLFIHREDPFNDFKVQPLLFKPSSRLGPGVAFADINGDNMQDVYIGGATSQEAIVLIGQADGEYIPLVQPDFQLDYASEDVGAIFFDLDNDGDQDLYVVSGGGSYPKSDDRYRDRLYLNDGKGLFTKNKSFMIEPTSGSSVSSCDYDRDGDIDLFVGGYAAPSSYPEYETSFLLENDLGQLKMVGSYDIGIVTETVWHDYDSDGFEDLLVVGEWMPLTILKNSGNKNLQQMHVPELENSRGLWSTIKIFDITGDTTPELLVGNLGQNNLFDVNNQHPLTSYTLDYDENGQKETIYSYYSDTEEWPIPRKELITGVLPHLRKKFLDNETYAQATIDEVISKENLAKSSQKHVQDLRSGYFEILEGQFRFTAFPKIAQSFPIHDFLVADIDQDGLKDILIGGNMSYSEVEQGPYDAGGLLVLMGGLDGFNKNNYQFLPEVGEVRRIRRIEDQLLIFRNDGPTTAVKMFE